MENITSFAPLISRPEPVVDQQKEVVSETETTNKGGVIAVGNISTGSFAVASETEKYSRMAPASPNVGPGMEASLTGVLVKAMFDSDQVRTKTEEQHRSEGQVETAVPPPRAEEEKVVNGDSSTPDETLHADVDSPEEKHETHSNAANQIVDELKTEAVGQQPSTTHDALSIEETAETGQPEEKMTGKYVATLSPEKVLVAHSAEVKKVVCSEAEVVPDSKGHMDEELLPSAKKDEEPMDESMEVPNIETVVAAEVTQPVEATTEKAGADTVSPETPKEQETPTPSKRKRKSQKSLKETPGSIQTRYSLRKTTVQQSKESVKAYESPSSKGMKGVHLKRRKEVSDVEERAQKKRKRFQ
ncbi:unnamed protein product [Soboliphyme baturini]|uniref:Serine/arginine repetitive matrix protein 2-like n=1 Tax=Soboliphyme baturini TaxID=241478 RepID=A0A183IJV3_9BILA|nr:unnamed protein product [Soboliphyme baturini]